MAAETVVKRSVGFRPKRFHWATNSASGGSGGSLSMRHSFITESSSRR